MVLQVNPPSVFAARDAAAVFSDEPRVVFRMMNNGTKDTPLFPQGKWSPWYDEHQFLTRNFYTRDEAMTTADIDEATKY